MAVPADCCVQLTPTGAYGNDGAVETVYTVGGVLQYSNISIYGGQHLTPALALGPCLWVERSPRDLTVVSPNPIWGEFFHLVRSSGRHSVA